MQWLAPQTNWSWSSPSIDTSIQSHSTAQWRMVQCRESISRTRSTEHSDAKQWKISTRWVAKPAKKGLWMSTRHSYYPRHAHTQACDTKVIISVDVAAEGLTQSHPVLERMCVTHREATRIEKNKRRPNTSPSWPRAVAARGPVRTLHVAV